MAKAKTGDIIEKVVVGDIVTVTLIDGSILKGMYVSLGITRGYAVKSLIPDATAHWEFNRKHVKSLVKG